jgi:hypothetical protein
MYGEGNGTETGVSYNIEATLANFYASNAQHSFIYYSGLAKQTNLRD